MFIKLYILNARFDTFYELYMIVQQLWKKNHPLLHLIKQAKFTIGMRCYNVADILCNGASSLEWPDLKPKIIHVYLRNLLDCFGTIMYLFV